MTNDEKILIQKMRAGGKGYKAIANELKVSVSTVASFCKSHDADASFEACPQCGARLINTPHRKKKKFCSDKCRMLWWNSHQDEINRQAYYRFVCPNCGKEFISYGNEHRKYCSLQCVAESRRKG